MSSIRRIRVLTPPVKRERFTRFGDLPPTISRTVSKPLRLADIEPDDMIVTGRRTFKYLDNFQGRLEARAVSIDAVYGSVHERIVYRELVRRKIEFDFQSSLLGARPNGTPLGGLVADFVLLDRPLVIMVQGRFWHDGHAAIMRDLYQADELKHRGWETEFLWDTTIENADLLEAWLRDYVDVRATSAPPSNAVRIHGRTN